MPKIKYIPNHFPKTLGTTLAKSGMIDCSWSDLVWSAITIGRREFPHIIRHGMYSYFEMVYRTAMLFSNLRGTLPQPISLLNLDIHLVQTSAYKDLDPSEKSAISYFLGLTIANYLQKNFWA